MVSVYINSVQLRVEKIAFATASFFVHFINYNVMRFSSCRMFFQHTDTGSSMSQGEHSTPKTFTHTCHSLPRFSRKVNLLTSLQHMLSSIPFVSNLISQLIQYSPRLLAVSPVHAQHCTTNPHAHKHTYGIIPLFTPSVNLLLSPSSSVMMRHESVDLVLPVNQIRSLCALISLIISAFKQLFPDACF